MAKKWQNMQRAQIAWGHEQYISIYGRLEKPVWAPKENLVLLHPRERQLAGSELKSKPQNLSVKT